MAGSVARYLRPLSAKVFSPSATDRAVDGVGVVDSLLRLLASAPTTAVGEIWTPRRPGLVTDVLFIYLFIYNNFICNNQYKKAAIREELNPHVR